MSETVLLHAEKRYLPVKLTEQEMEQKVGQFSRTLTLKGEMEARHEVKKSELKAEVKEMEGRVSREAKIIASRHEDREVACHLVLDPIKAKVSVVRQDTGEEIDVRPATQSELQRSISETIGEIPVQQVLDDVAAHVNSGALDGDGITARVTVHHADPFAEGADAAIAGHSDTSNPYDDGSDEQLEWNDGYNSVGEEVGDGDAE